MTTAAESSGPTGGPKVGSEDAAYYEWIRKEALAISSDGCTKATDWQVDCCYEHDLACVYKADPRDAYRLHLAGGENVWKYASPLSRRSADKRFKSCNLARSKGPIGSIRSFIRFIGVRIGALIP